MKEDDCPFIWYLLAERACSIAEIPFNIESEAIDNALIAKAERCYEINPHWRKQANKQGPDFVIRFMIHWLPRIQKEANKQF